MNEQQLLVDGRSKDHRWSGLDAAHPACRGRQGERAAVVDAVPPTGDRRHDDAAGGGVEAELMAGRPAQGGEQGALVDAAGPVETGDADQQRVRVARGCGRRQGRRRCLRPWSSFTGVEDDRGD